MILLLSVTNTRNSGCKSTVRPTLGTCASLLSDKHWLEALRRQVKTFHISSSVMIKTRIHRSFMYEKLATMNNCSRFTRERMREREDEGKCNFVDTKKNARSNAEMLNDSFAILQRFLFNSDQNIGYRGLSDL